MDDDNVILLFVGAIAVLALGYVAYSMYKKNVIAPSTEPCSFTLTEDFRGNPSNPVGYYRDAVKQPQAYSPLSSIVTNEENIKWTDWLGRDRTIIISRTVH
jgi:hypothetical protein